MLITPQAVTASAPIQTAAGCDSTSGTLAAALGALAAVAAYAALRRRAGLALAACLAFTPLALAIAGPALARYAASQSGAPLARAIAAAGADGRVRYERCYSPGTDFLLGRVSEILDPRGEVTTSNYQLRYRGRLVERKQWRLLDAPPSPDGAAIVVRPAREAAGADGAFFRDGRFAAYRLKRPQP